MSNVSLINPPSKHTTMKHILSLLLILLTTSCHALEPVSFQYEGEVAGVMCSACSNHVQTAVKTIPGVQSVTVTPAKDGGLPKLHITATSAKISREEAVKALGEKSKMYDVRSLKLIKAL